MSIRANLALHQKKFVNETSAVDAADKEELELEYDGLCAQVVRYQCEVCHTNRSVANVPLSFHLMITG